MRFETTPAFDSDYRRLKHEHADAFKKIVREKFAPACDAYAQNPSTLWPASLRVKAVRSAPGVLEMPWSFSSPDGRAMSSLNQVSRRLSGRPDGGSLDKIVDSLRIKSWRIHRVGRHGGALSLRRIRS